MRFITIAFILSITLGALALPKDFSSDPSFKALDDSNSTIPYPADSDPSTWDIVGPTEERQGQVYCDTSEASPTRTEIDGVVNLLHEKGEYCEQKNSMGSKCTTLVTYKGGAASICGKFFRVKCDAVADRVRDVQQKCEHNNWKAGGRFYWQDDKWMALW